MAKVMTGHIVDIWDRETAVWISVRTSRGILPVVLTPEAVEKIIRKEGELEGREVRVTGDPGAQKLTFLD
ncbi:MAG: hypothetical protein ACREDF_09520 [Thermoplasmata archaeon]